MRFTDRSPVDGTKVTQDGYLVASALAARTGVQDYLGTEVGKPEMRLVKVYRSPDEVFKRDTLASFTSLPITVDHPAEPVTADNWRKYAVGNSGEEVLRDGERMRIPLIVKDASAIQKIGQGKRELSCGYDCELDWTPGTTPEGLAYDAKQINIRGNHIAIVDAARGGPELKIGDEKVTTKTITIDGRQVEVSDAAEILITGLQRQLGDAQSSLTTTTAKVGELTTQLSTKDGEIAVLKKQVEDSKITPAKLDALVADRTKVIDQAKRLFPDLKPEGKELAAIRKEAVSHRLGDAATAMDDNAIIGAFGALAATVTDGDGSGQLRDALSGRQPPVSVADGDKKVSDAHTEMVRRLTNPHEKAA